MRHEFSTETTTLEHNTPAETPDGSPNGPIYPMTMRDAAHLIQHGAMPSERADRARDAVSREIAKQGYPRLAPQSPTRKPDNLYRIRLLNKRSKGALVLYSPQYDKDNGPIMPQVIYRVTGVDYGETPKVYAGVEEALNTPELVMEAAHSLWFDMTDGEAFEYPHDIAEREGQAASMVAAWADVTAWALDIEA